MKEGIRRENGMRTQPDAVGFEDEGDHQPRNAGFLQKLKKSKWIPTGSSRNSPVEVLFKLMTPRTVKRVNLC